ncbi:MAG: type II secretion system F family protein, partial [Candidatus Anstonellaceae archaeon]
MLLKIEEQAVAGISKLSLGFSLFSKASNEKIGFDLAKAGMQGNMAGDYLTGAAFLSLLVAFWFFGVFAIAGTDALDAFAASLLAFAASFLSLAYFPKILSARRAAHIEAELPFLLREFAVYLDIGMPFEKCMDAISKKGYILSQSFAFALHQIRSGSSVQQALSKLASQSDSMHLKRSIFMLNEVYETGSGSEQLKHFAESLSDLQSANLRMQSGKLALLSIAFISVCAILPAFFCIFLAVSPFFGEGINEAHQWLFFLFIFPLLGFAVLLAMLFHLPPNSSSSSYSLGSFLLRRGFKGGEKRLAILIVLPAFSMLLVALILGNAAIAVLALYTAPSAYFILSYLAEKENVESEAFLPDALHAAASVHKVLSPERMLSFLAKGGYGRLSEAFESALRRQKAGESFALSMQNALTHCDTFLTRRAFGMMVVSYETGADMGKALRETASDAASFFSLIKERAAVLSIQHYTLLAASAFLVPFILGLVASFVPSISQSALLAGLPDAQNGLSSLGLACQIYLAICSVFSSFALAVSSGKKSRWLLYL